MELDDLKPAWAELQSRAETAITLNLALIKENVIAKARRSMGWLGATLIYELLLGVCAAILTGSFLYVSRNEPKFWVPGLILHTAAVMTIALPTIQLVSLARIDYSDSVLAIQRRLAELGAMRARANKWILLCAPLLWTPLMIVACRALLGLDAYAAFGTTYILANVGVTLALIPLALWVSSLFAKKHKGDPHWRGIGADFAGQKIDRAKRTLEALGEFEH